MLVIALALLPAMASFASASGCSSDWIDTHGTTNWNNVWTYPTNCDEEFLEDWWETMFRMWEGNTIDNTYRDWVGNSNEKTVIDWSHDYVRSRFWGAWTDGWGSETGQCGVAVEYFTDRDVRNEVYAERIKSVEQGGDGWRDEIDIKKTFFPPYYVIAILDDGIDYRFGPYHLHDVLVIMSHAHSFYLKEEWCHGDYSRWDGWSYVGYNHDPQKTTECHNLVHILGCLNCMEYPGTGGDLDDAFRWLWTFAQWEGNPKNSMNCREDCWNVLSNYTDMAAINNTIYFEATGEDPGTVHEVYGYLSFGQLDNPVYLGSVPGRGSDGYGKRRTYSFSGPDLSSYVAFRIAERGNDEGRLVYSRHFSWSGDSELWEERLITQQDVDMVDIPEACGPDSIIYEVVPRGDTYDLVPISTEEISGRAMNLPEDPDSADVGDVVVYSTDGWSAWCAMNQAEKWNAWTRAGKIKARGYVGVGNLNATYAWLDTWTNNARWEGEEEFPYYPGPTLILVGDTEIIPPLVYEDNATQDCQAWDCVSDMEFAYWDGWYRALVTRVPSTPEEGNQELWTACQNADMWNAGMTPEGPIERKATFFCGDRQWGEEVLGFEEHVRYLEDQYIANAYSTEFLAYSDYTNTTELREAAAEAFGNMGSDLVSQANETSPHYISAFLNENMALSQLPEACFVLHAFDCQTNGVWEQPEDYYTTIVEYMMFNNRMAGAIGMFNGGWGFTHERAATLWAEIHSTIPPETALDPYLFDLFHLMRERNPHYAKGFSVLGAHLQTPPLNPATVEAPLPTSFELTKLTLPNGTAMRLSLPQQADVSFSIYDITGRRLLSHDENMVPPGVHAITWDYRDANGRNVPSGMYFARVAIPGHVRTVKVSVVR